MSFVESTNDSLQFGQVAAAVAVVSVIDGAAEVCADVGIGDADAGVGFAAKVAAVAVVLKLGFGGMLWS